MAEFTRKMAADIVDAINDMHFPVSKRNRAVAIRHAVLSYGANRTESQRREAVLMAIENALRPSHERYWRSLEAAHG